MAKKSGIYGNKNCVGDYLSSQQRESTHKARVVTVQDKLEWCRGRNAKRRGYVGRGRRSRRGCWLTASAAKVQNVEFKIQGGPNVHPRTPRREEGVEFEDILSGRNGYCDVGL
jgi:hypothetical protein